MSVQIIISKDKQTNSKHIATLRCGA